MAAFVVGVLVVTAVVHLLPAAGVLGRDRLASLYDVDVDDPVLLLLLRHRAVLFGGVALAATTGIFVESLRPAALTLGLLSTASYVVLWALGDGRGRRSTDRVALIDLGLVVLLVGALAAVTADS
jgi:hypothetical protein